MKRWLMLAAVTAALPVIALACGGDDSSSSGGVTPTSTVDGGKPNPTSTATNTSPTSTATTPVDAGSDAAHRSGCLDRPDAVERPDRLPCTLIPPGLTL